RHQDAFLAPVGSLVEKASGCLLDLLDSVQVYDSAIVVKLIEEPTDVRSSKCNLFDVCVAVGSHAVGDWNTRRRPSPCVSIGRSEDTVGLTVVYVLQQGGESANGFATSGGKELIVVQTQGGNRDHAPRVKGAVRIQVPYPTIKGIVVGHVDDLTREEVSEGLVHEASFFVRVR